MRIESVSHRGEVNGLADILRVSTPVVEKNQPVQPKPGLQPTNEFNLQQPNRVIQTHNQSELLGQNNAKLKGNDTPSILLDMLKDPDVTVSFLKNISMLEEIYTLLPANNNTVTPEIEQMFHQLLIDPEELAQEMQRQENSATLFKGPFFDFLREISLSKTSQGETQRAIANLMRSMNNLLCHEDILDAVANSLVYLEKNLNSSKSLTGRIAQLVSVYRQDDSVPFDKLKGETLSLLRDIENSILYSPKISKTISITTYNLSRYNESVTFFQEAVVRLRQMLNGSSRQKLTKFAGEFLTWVRNGKPEDGAEQAGVRLARNGWDTPQASQGSLQEMPQQSRAAETNAPVRNAADLPAESETDEPLPPQEQSDLPEEPTEVPRQKRAAENPEEQENPTSPQTAGKEQEPAPKRQHAAAMQGAAWESAEKAGGFENSAEAMERLPSKVMDALVGMIAKEASKEELSSSEEKRLDNILSSLLSSPCNFTPLLHFVVPAYFEQIRAFAEIWINPESDAKDMPPGVDHGIHLLMVVDAEAVGRFEAEVFAHDKTIDIHLYCPQEYEKQMKSYLSDITNALKGYTYRIGQVRLAPLLKARSLMDVFKSLPYKRVGVDVKI